MCCTAGPAIYVCCSLAKPLCWLGISLCRDFFLSLKAGLFWNAWFFSFQRFYLNIFDNVNIYYIWGWSIAIYFFKWYNVALGDHIYKIKCSIWAAFKTKLSFLENSVFEYNINYFRYLKQGTHNPSQNIWDPSQNIFGIHHKWNRAILPPEVECESGFMNCQMT